MSGSVISAAVVERQPRYAWVVMAILWGIDLMATMVFFSVGILLPIWKADLGVSPVQAGLLGSAGFLGFGLMALPASIWLTKYNPRWMTLACALGMALLAVLQSFSPTVELLLIGRLAFVLLMVSRLQVQVMFLQQWFQPRLYSTINSLDFSARSVGQVLALAATPPLILLLGNWRHFYLAVAIGLVAFSLVWALGGRERQRPARANVPRSAVGNPAGVLRRHKVLWLMAASQMGEAAAFACFISFFPTYAIDRLGISLTTIGLIMSLFPAGQILGSLLAGPLSQAIGLRKPFIWVPGLILPVMYTALLHTDQVPVLILLLLVTGALAFAVGPVLFTMPLDMGLNPREVAIAFGLMRTLFPLGATVGPIFVGLMYQATGSLLLGLSIVAPLPITYFLCGVFLPETGPKGRRHSSQE
ncbi:MAG: MFS transporter [Chloroflexota bacterium]